PSASPLPAPRRPQTRRGRNLGTALPNTRRSSAYTGPRRCAAAAAPRAAARLRAEREGARPRPRQDPTGEIVTPLPRGGRQLSFVPCPSSFVRCRLPLVLCGFLSG